MAETHVISALVAKRAEIAGMVLKHQEELNRLTRHLVNLDATIKLFEPDYDLSSIRPVKRRERDPLFSHGEISRLVLESFRELDGRATTRQVVDAIHAAKGIAEPDTDAIGTLQKRVNAYLKRNPEQFRITGRDAEGVNVWELTP